MAQQTWSLGSFNSDSVRVWFLWDDVTHTITDLEMANDGATGTLTAIVKNLSDVVIFQGSQAFATGMVDHPVSIPMVQKSGTDHLGRAYTIWVPPFTVTLQWSSV